MPKTAATIESLVKTMPLLKIGQLIQGQILAIDKKGLFVNLGPHKTGVVLGREIKENKEAIKKLKPGDTLDAMIVNLENEEGYIELSLKEAYQKKTWQSLKELKDNQTPIEAKITQANRGGLIIKIDDITGFLPVSQLSSQNYPRIENGDTKQITNQLNKFVNQSIKVKIIDLDPAQEKLIVSEKALEEEKLKELLNQYQIGDVIEAKVTSVTDFGAFVEFPSQESIANDDQEKQLLDGLIHISELSWQLIDDPRKIIKVGDIVKAKIISINDKRLALSLKALQKDPWDNIETKFKKDDIIKGKPVRFTPFGAFVQLTDEIYGLVHISDFGTDEKMKETLQLNEEYKFKITSLDVQQRKISLTFNQ